eukprot:141574-Rhodomonas_salina.2
MENDEFVSYAGPAKSPEPPESFNDDAAMFMGGERDARSQTGRLDHDGEEETGKRSPNIMSAGESTPFHPAFVPPQQDEFASNPLPPIFGDLEHQ